MNNSLSITFDNPHYPSRLRSLPNSPKELFYRGNLACLELDLIAVIGSRTSTRGGEFSAGYFARTLVQHGYSVISELANGIDSAALSGALSTRQKMAAIAVCQSSLDDPRLTQGPHIFKKITEEGLILSESTNYLNNRDTSYGANRIIAALCKAVLIIEAGPYSGTLITANYCNHLGKQIFAIPHKPWDKNSQGCNRLIQQGAKAVTNISDILEELMT